MTARCFKILFGVFLADMILATLGVGILAIAPWPILITAVLWHFDEKQH
jgi:hypothetical protein